jgi:hypothetical protein
LTEHQGKKAQGSTSITLEREYVEGVVIQKQAGWHQIQIHSENRVPKTLSKYAMAQRESLVSPVGAAMRHNQRGDAHPLHKL